MIKRFLTHGTLNDLPRSGRPSVTSEADDLLIKLISMRNRCSTARQIRAEFNDDGNNVEFNDDRKNLL